MIYLNNKKKEKEKYNDHRRNESVTSKWKMGLDDCFGVWIERGMLNIINKKFSTFILHYLHFVDNR